MVLVMEEYAIDAPAKSELADCGRGAGGGTMPQTIRYSQGATDMSQLYRCP